MVLECGMNIHSPHFVIIRYLYLKPSAELSTTFCMLHKFTECVCMCTLHKIIPMIGEGIGGERKEK